MGVITVRVSKAVFEAQKGLLRTERFESEYELYQVALRQAAGPQSILTPGTVAMFPRPEGPRSERMHTYLSNAEDRIVRDKFGRNMGSVANAWVWLVANGVSAPGTAALMDHRVHRGPAPRSW